MEDGLPPKGDQYPHRMFSQFTMYHMRVSINLVDWLISGSNSSPRLSLVGEIFSSHFEGLFQALCNLCWGFQSKV